MGVALVSDLSDLSDKMGAPVFALTGYAVASHVIPRGGGAAAWNGSVVDLPQGYAGLFLWQRRYAGCVGVALAWEFLGFFGIFWEGYWCAM